MRSISQNRFACASPRNGSPSSVSCQAPKRNRSSPFSLPLKACEICEWKLRNTLTQNSPPLLKTRWVAVDLLTQTSKEGGSNDSEVTAVALIPWRHPPLVQDIMLTVVANLLIASRNTALHS